MHWILQENLINPDTRAGVELALKERNTPYSLARLVPIFNVLDNEVATPSEPVFVYGSTGLGIVAKDRGWTPGYFDENLDYRLLLEHHGAYALNSASTVAPLNKLTRSWDQFFIRPIFDNKSFAGTVMTWDELEAFRAGVERVKDDLDVTLRPTDIVVMAALTEIFAEYRFFVIDGRVVTGSLYRWGAQVVSSTEVPSDIARYAQDRVDQWSPNRAFVIDIAQTPTGPRVIEMNSANSAGFYACDVGLIIEAVNRMQM